MSRHRKGPQRVEMFFAAAGVRVLLPQWEVMVLTPIGRGHTKISGNIGFSWVLSDFRTRDCDSFADSEAAKCIDWIQKFPSPKLNQLA